LELQHALAVEVGDRELDEENIPQIEDMVNVCAGLVTVDEESNVIRLVHYTTQEYFERTQEKWFPNADVSVAKTCITYLSFDVFETGFCPTDEDFEKRLLLNPLFDYAARNWGHHARVARVKVKDLVLGFLESGAKISASSQATMASRGSPGYSQRVHRQTTRLHLTAYFGLSEVIMALLLDGHNPNVRDSYHQTPLLLAAANGHDTAVSLLLAGDSIDINCEDKHGRTPVSWAAENGHEAVMKQLLATDGVNPNSKDNYDQTPLSWAAANGHSAVVDLLSAKDRVNSALRDTLYGSTLLSRAAKDGNEAAVKLFLTHIHPDSMDESGQTPLTLAAAHGHDAIVKLMTAMDNVNPDFMDSQGKTALMWAGKSGHESVVRLKASLTRTIGKQMTLFLPRSLLLTPRMVKTMTTKMTWKKLLT
jgi:ankyrin repeat protein